MTVHPYDRLEQVSTRWLPCVRCGVRQAPLPMVLCRRCYDEVRGHTVAEDRT